MTWNMGNVRMRLPDVATNRNELAWQLQYTCPERAISNYVCYISDMKICIRYFLFSLYISQPLRQYLISGCWHDIPLQVNLVATESQRKLPPKYTHVATCLRLWLGWLKIASAPRWWRSLQLIGCACSAAQVGLAANRALQMRVRRMPSGATPFLSFEKKRVN